MKEFWNNRYKKKKYAYGKEPNKYFRKEIDKINPGKILLAAEGEGRNAVYAASIGWEVYAYDFSEFAYQKAVSLAKEKNVKINYQIGSLSDLNFDENYFDVIGLIFVHFPDSIRHKNHKALSDLLKQEGNIIMEAFSNNHLKYQLINPNVGGPKYTSPTPVNVGLNTDSPETIDFRKPPTLGALVTISILPIM